MKNQLFFFLKFAKNRSISSWNLLFFIKKLKKFKNMKYFYKIYKKKSLRRLR